MCFSVLPTLLEKVSNGGLDFWNLSELFLCFEKLMMWMCQTGSQEGWESLARDSSLKGKNMRGPPASFHGSVGPLTQQSPTVVSKQGDTDRIKIAAPSHESEDLNWWGNFEIIIAGFVTAEKLILCQDKGSSANYFPVLTQQGNGNWWTELFIPSSLGSTNRKASKFLCYPN